MKRSERLVDMVQYLTTHPHTLISLPFFATRYDSAKSSISEDLAILRNTFAKYEIGILETVAGVAGGVRLIPFIGFNTAEDYLKQLADRIEDPERILPGNFIYLSDVLGDPQELRHVGELIVTKYAYSNVDYVMTIETKGIAIANSVSRLLNVPYVLVRRRPKITEGATVSVNYVASSSDRVEKMELAKRSLPEGSNVLIVDDFMKGGGTLNGMEELTKEFKCHVVGMCVLCEASNPVNKVVDDYQTLVKITEVDRSKGIIKAKPGNLLEQIDFQKFPK